jgi:hypothetical protein
MVKFLTVLVLSLAFICGCASQSQMRKEFLSQENEYGDKYSHAKTPEDAIIVLKDYLKMVDHFQHRGFTEVRYGVARGFAETRIAIIYEELGDKQSARIYMDRALADIHQDKQYQDIDEQGLKRIIAKIDGWHTQDWRKAGQ